jgi:signal transduction histidine kinase
MNNRQHWNNLHDVKRGAYPENRRTMRMNSLLDENTQGPILTSREVRERYIELEKAMKDLKEEYRSFVHTMAHDIRGCFNAVLGYAQLLKEVHNPEYANTIVESVHRMTRLLDRSVRLVDLGVPVGWLSEVDLNRVIPAVASSVLPAEVEFLHDRLPIVLGDPDKVAQAVQNLFVNAVEHGRANRVEVRKRSAKGGICILFRNDGLSIPDEFRSRLFREQVSSKRGGGMGLGIAQKIVRAHGWSITLDPVKIPTFRIYIPQSSLVEI